MTDNEMIELLLNDVAARHSYFLCFDKENKSHIIRTMDICDIIIRLMTENKGLTAERDAMHRDVKTAEEYAWKLKEQLKTAKSEAVKEVVRRLKKIGYRYKYFDTVCYEIKISEKDLANLVNETVGESNE